ncbi:hypothetical protein ACFQU9_45085 [Actinomadura namibiensis]|uniref:hypothetical protein n=1 Tax=Actinomadura kijaniata TaxID=46161 RepID=UPI0036128A1C
MGDSRTAEPGAFQGDSVSTTVSDAGPPPSGRSPVHRRPTRRSPESDSDAAPWQATAWDAMFWKRSSPAAAPRNHTRGAAASGLWLANCRTRRGQPPVTGRCVMRNSR